MYYIYYLFLLDLPCPKKFPAFRLRQKNTSPANSVCLFSAGSWACWTNHSRQLSAASHPEISGNYLICSSACCTCFLKAARCVDDNWLPAKVNGWSLKPTTSPFSSLTPAPDSVPKTGCFWAEKDGDTWWDCYRHRRESKKLTAF